MQCDDRAGGAGISIHALHEESDFPFDGFNIRNYISIHALHEESDVADGCDVLRGLRISIHALHEESDISSTCPNSPPC